MSNRQKKGSAWKWGMAVGAIGGYWAWQAWRAEQGKGRFLQPLAHKGTALITGASSGIGEAFARQLAKAAYDVVLVARREDRLQRLASELSTHHGVLAEVLAADLATAEGVERVEEKIGQLRELTLLVNNAGFGTHGPLIEQGLFKQLDMLHLHINATMRLTRAAATGMSKRGFGGIINVSSITGFFYGADSANYCATKAYLNSFSQSVAAEVKAAGVYVQALCPGYTYTGFHDTGEYDHWQRSSTPSWLWGTADEVATASLQALGNGQVIVIPGWQNKLLVGVGQLNIDLAQLRRLGKFVTDD